MTKRVLPPECPLCGVVPGSGTPHMPTRALSITVAHIMVSHPDEYAEYKAGRQKFLSTPSGGMDQDGR